MSTLHGQMSVGYISYRLTHLFSAQHPCFLSVIPPMPVTSLTPKKSCRCHLVVGESIRLSGGGGQINEEGLGGELGGLLSQQVLTGVIGPLNQLTDLETHDW